MHEFSLMADLFRKIDSISKNQTIKQNTPAKVLMVKVKLGALSHITPEHFTEHFNAFSKGTVAEGASLEIIMLEDMQDPNAQDIIVDSVELTA